MKSASQIRAAHHLAQWNRRDWKRVHSGRRDRSIAKLDRIIVTCDQDPVCGLSSVEYLRAEPPTPAYPSKRGGFQPYSRRQRFLDSRSDLTFVVHSKRRQPWLSRYSVTVIADDAVGLLPKELLAIIAALPPTKLRFAELAIDFSPKSRVTRSFIKRHGLFGKTRSDHKRDSAFGDGWGAPRGRYNVVSYSKLKLGGGQRLEIKMRWGFLARYGISQVSELPKLAAILPRRHIEFANVNLTRLKATPRIARLEENARRRILRRTTNHSIPLWGTLDFLRHAIGIQNTRRFIAPAAEDHLVVQALRKWQTLWTAGATSDELAKRSEQISNFLKKRTKS